jgi:hypothetical protein
MLSLKVLQAKVAPITVEEIRIKREKTFELILQDRIYDPLKSLFLERGVPPKMMGFYYHLDSGILSSTLDNCHELASYSRDRLEVLFPDFEVVARVFVTPACFCYEATYSIDFILTRREPAHAPTPTEESVSESDVLLKKTD